MSKRRRAALICRVSTVDKQSNERQWKELTALAESKGYLVEKDDIYADKISGFTPIETRPSLYKLLTNIKTKKKRNDMIFTMEVSRASRNLEQGEKVVEGF